MRGSTPPSRLYEIPVFPDLRKNFAACIQSVCEGRFAAITRSLIHRPNDSHRQVAAIGVPIDWWGARVLCQRRDATDRPWVAFDWQAGLEQARGGTSDIRFVPRGWKNTPLAVDFKGAEEARDTLTPIMNRSAGRDEVHTVVRRWREPRMVLMPPAAFAAWTGTTVSRLRITPAS